MAEQEEALKLVRTITKLNKEGHDVTFLACDEVGVSGIKIDDTIIGYCYDDLTCKEVVL